MPKKQKTKYTAKELKEFEKLILDKIKDAQGELDFIKESLLRKNLSGTDSTQGALKTLEDGADTMEKESLSQLAGRQQKFIHNLEKALIRIKNGTYGICKDTGVLIDKKRLLVPFPLILANLSAKFFQLLPNPLLTEDQLRLLKYDNVKSGKYKTNFDIGVPSKRYFDDEVSKYSYMWREGGQFSTEKYSTETNDKI